MFWWKMFAVIVLSAAAVLTLLAHALVVLEDVGPKMKASMRLLSLIIISEERDTIPRSSLSCIFTER